MSASGIAALFVLACLSVACSGETPTFQADDSATVPPPKPGETDHPEDPGNPTDPVPPTGAGLVIFADDFERGNFTRWSPLAPASSLAWTGRGKGGSHAGDGYITNELAHSGRFSWRAQVDPSTPQPDPAWNIGKSGLARWEVLDGIYDFTISTWYYFPSDYPPVFSNIMQIKEREGHRPTAVIAVHKYELVLYEGLNQTVPARSGVTVARDRWVNITSQFVIDRYNGRVITWLDGRKVLDVGGLNTLGTADDVYFGVGNYVSAETVTQCHLYVDDVVVTRSTGTL